MFANAASEYQGVDPVQSGAQTKDRLGQTVAEDIDRKIRAVAVFLDILLARRAVNYLSMTYGAMSYAAFLIMRDIRGLDLPQLVDILRKRLDEQGCDFDGTTDGRRGGFNAFRLNQWSKRYIKALLARMTAHLERASGIDSSAALLQKGSLSPPQFCYLFSSRSCGNMGR